MSNAIMRILVIEDDPSVIVGLDNLANGHRNPDGTYGLIIGSRQLSVMLVDSFAAATGQIISSDIDFAFVDSATSEDDDWYEFGRMCFETKPKMSWLVFTSYTTWHPPVLSRERVDAIKQLYLEDERFGGVITKPSNCDENAWRTVIGLAISLSNNPRFIPWIGSSDPRSILPNMLRNIKHSVQGLFLSFDSDCQIASSDHFNPDARIAAATRLQKTLAKMLVAIDSSSNLLFGFNDHVGETNSTCIRKPLDYNLITMRAMLQVDKQDEFNNTTERLKEHITSFPSIVQLVEDALTRVNGVEFEPTPFLQCHSWFIKLDDHFRDLRVLLGDACGDFQSR